MDPRTNAMAVVHSGQSVTFFSVRRLEDLAFNRLVAKHDIEGVEELIDTHPTLWVLKPLLEKKVKETRPLLIAVLQGEHDKIIEIAKKNPEYFFIKNTAQDYAMDLDGNRRTYKNWSPYQALFSVGSLDTIEAVMPYLDVYLSTRKDGAEMVESQKKEKFPNGFDYPASTFDFSKLVTAITVDAQLKEDPNKPSAATILALNHFRKHFNPGVVTVGYPFNINDFIKAYDLYDSNRMTWNRAQSSFFAVGVIGYLERMLPAPFLHVFCLGIKRIIIDDELNYSVLKHSPKIMNFSVGREVNVLPLDADPSFRLGLDCVVDCYHGYSGRQVDGERFAYLDYWKKLFNNNILKLSMPISKLSESCVILLK